MNPNKPNLEDYYKKALSEEPIVSRDMARSLVESRRKNPAPLSLKTSGRKTMNIIAYSTAALITAGIVAYNAFDYNPGKIDVAAVPAAGLNSTGNIAMARPEVTPDENVAYKKTGTTESGATEETAVPERGGTAGDHPASGSPAIGNPGGSPAPAENMISPDVKGISMITLRQSELEKLGLKVNNMDKSILLGIEQNKAVRLSKSKVEVTSTGGLSDFGDEDIHVVPNNGTCTVFALAPEKQTSDTTQYIIPRFVTDVKGAMRFSMLNEESSKFYSVNNPTLDGGTRSEKVDVMELNLDNDKNPGGARSKKVTAVIQSSGKNNERINVDAAVSNTSITLTKESSEATGAGNLQSTVMTSINVADNDSSHFKLAINDGTNMVSFSSSLTSKIKEIIKDAIIKRANEEDPTGKMGKKLLQQIESSNSCYINSKNNIWDSLSQEDKEFMKSLAIDSLLKSPLSSSPNSLGMLLKDSIIANMKIVQNGKPAKMESSEFYINQNDNEKIISFRNSGNSDTLHNGFGSIKISNARVLEPGYADSVTVSTVHFQNPSESVSVSDNMEQMKNKLDEYIRINKFIPVAVSLDGITTDYIVWFDPTPELMEKLPKDVSDRLMPEIETLSKNGNICEYAAVKGDDTMMDIFRACNGAIENLAVSPNPTNGNIKLNYKLTEARNITVAVHDMYGRRKMNLAENLHMQAGPCENNFVITGVEPGMYLIVVRSETGEKAVQRIIIK